MQPQNLLLNKPISPPLLKQNEIEQTSRKPVSLNPNMKINSTAVRALQKNNIAMKNVQQVRQIVRQPYQPKVELPQGVNLKSVISEDTIKGESQIACGLQKKFATEKELEPDYIYLHKLSPICRFCCQICVIYIIVLFFSTLILATNIYGCGLDSYIHTLRMRKITSPIYGGGIIPLTDRQNYPTYYNVSYDIVRLLDINLYEEQSYKDENSEQILYQLAFNFTNGNGENISQKVVNTTLQYFPMSVIINNTRRITTYINSISFNYKDDLSYADNGAAFDICTISQVRARVSTDPAFFNYNYWTGTGFTLSYTKCPDCNKFNVTLNQSKFDATQKKDVGTLVNSTWSYVNSSSNMTIMPLWMINLDSLIEASGQCATPYDIQISLFNYFQISPFIIRDTPYSNIQFNNITESTTSDIMFDFEKVSTGNLSYSFSNCKINGIWLTSAQNDTVNISISQSTVTIYVPDFTKTQATFYGVVGNKQTNSLNNSFYQMEYHVQYHFNQSLSIVVNDGNIICQQNQTFIITADSRINFVLENPNNTYYNCKSTSTNSTNSHGTIVVGKI